MSYDRTLAKTFENFEDDELKVIKYILVTPKPIYQSRISKYTSISKVKVSRILTKFLSIDIISKERYGMTNIVKLK